MTDEGRRNACLGITLLNNQRRLTNANASVGTLMSRLRGGAKVVNMKLP